MFLPAGLKENPRLAFPSPFRRPNPICGPFPHGAPLSSLLYSHLSLTWILLPLPLMGTLHPPYNDPGDPPHLKILNRFTSAKSLLLEGHRLMGLPGLGHKHLWDHYSEIKMESRC